MQDSIREQVDKALVERSVQGDVNAFRELVESHLQPVMSIISAMVTDPLEADDIAQEVFIKVHRNLRDFRGQSRFSVWLYRVTTNQCLDRIKHWKRRPDSVPLSQIGEESDDVLGVLFEDPTPDASVLHEDIQLQQSVRRVLDSLAPDYRSVILLKDLEGYSQDEIAEMLGCPVGTVKSRLTRAREALKKKLRPFYDAWKREEVK